MCSGRPSLEAFGQRRGKFKLPGAELSWRARQGRAAVQSRLVTVGNPLGSQERQLSRVKGRSTQAKSSGPRVPHAGPAVPARSVSAPGSRARASHLQACLQPSSLLGSSSSLQVTWPRLPPPGWSRVLQVEDNSSAQAGSSRLGFDPGRATG